MKELENNSNIKDLNVENGDKVTEIKDSNEKNANSNAKNEDSNIKNEDSNIMQILMRRMLII